MENFDAVLENYGVSRVDGLVFEGDAQHYAAQMPYYLVPTVNSTDITSDVASSGYYILMPYAQGIQKSDDVRDTVNIESLLTTSDSAYSKTDLNSGSLEKEDGDVDGPFDLGVSITETVDDDKETHIIYYSTSNLLQSQINQMVSGGNEKLVMASLSSLVDMVRLNTPVRPIANQYREGKVKRTPSRGVKEILNPCAYKRSELPMAVTACLLHNEPTSYHHRQG